MGLDGGGGLRCREARLVASGRLDETLEGQTNLRAQGRLGGVEGFDSAFGGCGLLLSGFGSSIFWRPQAKVIQRLRPSLSSTTGSDFASGETSRATLGSWFPAEACGPFPSKCVSEAGE